MQSRGIKINTLPEYSAGRGEEEIKDKKNGRRGDGKTKQYNESETVTTANSKKKEGKIHIHVQRIVEGTLHCLLEEDVVEFI